jgi:Ner family transcriptional regulator
MAKQPSGWHPEDIRAAVRKKFGTVSALAQVSGYAKSSFSNVLAYGLFMPGPCGAISEAIGISRHTLWPHWYHLDDTAKLGRDAKRTETGSSDANYTLRAERRRAQTRDAA